MITEKSDNKSCPILISVVVPAYNVEATIDACLNSLLSQTLSRDSYEVIVVDNGSMDETAAIIRNYPVTYIYEPNCTVYAARNAGVSVAAGDIIAFTDSDCVVDKKWLESGLEHLRQFDIVAGQVEPLPSARKWLYTYDKYIERNTLKKMGSNVNIAALNAFVPKTVFEILGGFEGTLKTAADSVFSIKAWRQGYKIGYATSALVYHPVDGWVHRIRRMMRESYGSEIKSFYQWDKSTNFLIKISSRMANAWRLFQQDMANVRRAWSRNEIDTMLAIGIIGIYIFMRLFTYGSIVTARIFGKMNQKLALP